MIKYYPDEYFKRSGYDFKPYKHVDKTNI
jgi:hypothetical protein